ncbi:uncharacterized protein LOC127788901 isoform X2 [Diospyros lotus]|uniref:uncharacterized protein LOC127788901 isoform X2 n=1 Tax=Diospyros lotus TaxID=55363 RepID=UPI00225A6881|nr:uncharacterized protein LOC127788901 isoform X2 [Diospyros lotus]
MGGLKFDKWGYEVNTASDACISAINSFYHQKQASKYEKAVFDAVSSLIAENRDDDVALELHSKLLEDFPRDLVSLKRAQILCFYMGRPDLSLNLVQKVLPQNEQENYIYGMLAFSLLETGRMADAEKAAKKGLQINREDSWAQHALCHVLQHECRFKEAVGFMEECSKSWNSLSSFMCTHNWWHVALCYLEGHSPMRKVLDVYDHCIWKELERNHAVPREVYLNALGLLLRVYLRGEIDIIEDRLKILAGCLTNQDLWYLEWHLDVLTVWALASTGEYGKGEDLLKGLRSRISKMSNKKRRVMQGGMLLAEAMYEYGKGNYSRALELLGPDFDANRCKAIGASDEQLDVFNEVWYVAMLNTGRAAEAIKVLESRTEKREGVPFMWRLLERAYSMLGRPEATAAREKAKHLEDTCFK